MLQADAAKRLQRVVAQRQTLRDVFSPAPSKQAGLIREIVAGSVRFYPTLTFLLKQLLKKPIADEQVVHSLLVLGLYQVWRLDIPTQVSVNETVAACRLLKQDWACGLVNAVLRNFLRQRSALLKQVEKDLYAQTAHPEWLLKQIQADHPEHWQAIVEANNCPAPPCLRINTSKVTVEEYQALLAKQDIDAIPLAYAPQALLLPKSINITTLPGYAEGLFYVQDAVAQLAVPLLDLAPRQRVLDACSAPGGKTTHLFEIEPQLEQVVTIDNNRQRLHVLKDNLKRMGLTKAPIKQLNQRAESTGDWWDAKRFDRILLDAPCTATGVIRRQPDVKLHRDAEQLNKVCQLQKRLLESLWRCLAPGGRLVYVVCSVLRAEGHQQIEQFTQQHKDAKLLPTKFDKLEADNGQIRPTTEHDGFFIACLEKDNH